MPVKELELDELGLQSLDEFDLDVRITVAPRTGVHMDGWTTYTTCLAITECIPCKTGTTKSCLHC
jgi:hypothetical protein